MNPTCKHTRDKFLSNYIENEILAQFFYPNQKVLKCKTCMRLKLYMAITKPLIQMFK